MKEEALWVTLSHLCTLCFTGY